MGGQTVNIAVRNQCGWYFLLPSMWAIRNHNMRWSKAFVNSSLPSYQNTPWKLCKMRRICVLHMCCTSYDDSNSSKRLWWCPVDWRTSNVTPIFTWAPWTTHIFIFDACSIYCCLNLHQSPDRKQWFRNLASSRRRSAANSVSLFTKLFVLACFAIRLRFLLIYHQSIDSERGRRRTLDFVIPWAVMMIWWQLTGAAEEGRNARIRFGHR